MTDDNYLYEDHWSTSFNNSIKQFGNKKSPYIPLFLRNIYNIIAESMSRRTIKICVMSTINHLMFKVKSKVLIGLKTIK